MISKFVVTDEDGNISWSEKAEAAESFGTFAAAEKRAQALAKSAPGGTVRIYSLTAEVVTPIGAVKTTRFRP